jgi:hypothetical protein
MVFSYSKIVKYNYINNVFCVKYYLIFAENFINAKSMKKILITCFFLSCFTIYSQEEQEPVEFNKNEIKLNMLYFLLGAVEVSYERNLNEYSSIGTSVLINTNDSEFWDLNYAITPYYRLFFGKKPAQGFFFEGFGMLNSYKEYEYWSYYNPEIDYYFYEESSRNTTSFAIGVAVGGKFVLRERFVTEISGGIGRNFINNSEYNDYTIVPRFSISLGYRF